MWQTPAEWPSTGADTGRMSQHGDVGVALNVFHEAVGTAGDEEIDVLVHLQDLGDVLPGLHQDEGLAGHSCGSCRFPEDVEEYPVGPLGLGTSLEQDGVAALEAERHDLRDHFGPRFEDDPDQSDGAPLLIELEALIQFDGGHDLSHGILDACDVEDTGDHIVDFVVVELKPLEDLGRHVALGLRHIGSVCFKDVLPVADYGVRHSFQCLVLRPGIEGGHLKGR